MKLKKIIAGVTILFALTTSVFAAKAKKSDKLKVVTTIFPEYDWTREILGDNAKNVELTLLLGNGVDLHSYQPSIQDIAKISTADIFIYVGGESDGWVKDALKNATNKNMKVINLMETLGDKVKAEEVKEGMQVEEEEEHAHHHGKEVSTFEDNEVKDRSLSDWEGSWQSPYPLVLDGTLDEAWEEKSEDGKMTAQEYKEYYKTGYKTDIASLTIKGNKITYKYDNGKSVSAKYKYVGYFIQVWSGGTKAAMYRFESMDKKSTAPRFIEINDHMIEPAEAEHFHLRMSNISFDAIEDPEKYWPTFFPASMSGKEIAEHLSGGHHHHDEDEDEEHEHHDHEAEGHHHHHHHHSSDEEEVEYDEHVWLSVRNAKILCTEITNALCDVDSTNAAAYKANYNAYAAKLDKLDSDFTAVVKNGKTNTLLFGDRFPFRYFVDDYGLKYYAAFVGCSAETEASFETIIFLANKVDELSLNNVCQIESGNGKIARTIIQSSKKKNAKILTFDSMQSTTTKDIKKGTSYLGIMQKNLEVLKEALK
ncbi:MAG: ZinT/AdcA family metal-binding protein [Treponema sp.]|nr:ZinT/AdcA family metal-binding protein [Treponema sp.]